MIEEITRARWASVMYNGDFYCVETWSGYGGGAIQDPKGSQHLLAPDVSDEELGLALLDALAHSRFVLSAPKEGVTVHPEVEYDFELYDRAIKDELYLTWTEFLMKRYGYKTKRALFKNMQNCSIRQESDILIIIPTYHQKLEQWGGKIEPVVLPYKSTAAEIGAALREGFRRCVI